MEGLKQACIDGNIIKVRKYFSVIKQCSMPLKEQEKIHKPLVYWAAKAGQLEVLKELIEKYGCDPIYATERGHTLIYVACARGRTSVARYLAQKYGIDPNQRNNMHSTPLFAASNNGHFEVMIMLIDELKCDPMAVNDKGESLLHRACGGGHLRVVKCLITKYGLNPEARSAYGDTPLHDACGKGHLIVVQYLTEVHQCKINVFNNLHSTPLHIACRNGCTEVVCYLVENQICDKTPYDTSGSTPLHLACKFRRKDVVKCMLEVGKLDPNLLTLNGEMPINMSRDPNIITCLIRSGAKPVGVIDTLERFKQKTSLDGVVHIILVGDTEVGKSTLAQALQKPITTCFGGLITKANTITTSNSLSSTVGTVCCVITSPDFGHVLLYDCAGGSNFHAGHGALLQYTSISSAPLFLVVVNLNEDGNDVKR